MTILGVDISKKQLDVALLKEGKLQNKIFTNNLQGFDKLNQWVQSYSSSKVLVCMEATGFYGEPLAEFLYSNEYSVSVVNPFCIKSYTQSKLVRHKTDKKDGALIAEYAFFQNPPLWRPVNPTLKKLRELYRCSQSLKIQLNEVTNHLENPNLSYIVIKTWQILQVTILKQIKNAEIAIVNLITKCHSLHQDYQNLQTIPGISKTTAIAILAEVPAHSSFKDARQLAAFAGLTPKQRVSCSSVRGKPRLSKIGLKTIRKALYFPAIVAKKYNPIIKKFCESLKAKGKHPMAIIGAAMRKLLHIIFGVLKNKKPFNEKIV